MSWTDEQVELLTTLWRNGMSASQISKKLGDASRNAVLGKIHRLRLAGQERLSRTTTRPVGTRSLATASRPPRPAARTRAAYEEIPGPGLATIVTLEPHMCRWPIGDPLTKEFTFCGRPASTVYCDRHAVAAYARRAPAARVQV
jgi:GcrA cell cycle regulator